MSYDNMLGILNGLAADFMFLDDMEIDIPLAGKFLNQLEKIAQDAGEDDIGQVGEVTAGLNKLLEKIILNVPLDMKAALEVLEAGILLLQAIVDSHYNTGRYDGNTCEFFDRIAALTGEATTPSKVFLADSVASTAAKSEQEGLCPDMEEKSAEGTVALSEKVEVQDESLLRDFIIEALEYIGEIEVNILNLERNPADKEYINAIFRPFHSIKGVASFLGLDHIRDLAHNLENLLDKARNSELDVSPHLIDVVLDGADTLKEMIVQLRERTEGRGQEILPIDTSSLLERIALVECGGGAPIETRKIGEILLEEGVITPAVLEESLKIVQSTPGKKLGETLISGAQATPKQVSQALRKQTEQVTDTGNIRVDTRKLDDLIDLVGELVITQSMLQEDVKKQENADKKLVRDVAQFIRMTSALQKLSTSLRMVPIKQTFQRMSRLVRDLAKNSGKIISVEMVGEETEIDRNMVDEIYNPLVHMIRNSVDHGIEKPEERKKQGKNEKGLIYLKAYHRGGTIVIEIGDDGSGLDKKKIVNKAIKNCVLDSAEGLSDQDIFRLIFLPGLSTAEKITDVSGRGVGMDVVRGAVEKLRGKIDIESTLGKGTTFIAAFPLTLAIIDGMIVKVGAEYYILPTTAIRNVLRPRKESYNNVIGKGEIITVMGRLLPLVRLHQLFGIKTNYENPWEATVVVVGGASTSKALMVDKIIGKTEVVIKSLGEGLGKIKGVSGAAILGDGRIGLILDTEGLFAITEAKDKG